MKNYVGVDPGRFGGIYVLGDLVSQGFPIPTNGKAMDIKAFMDLCQNVLVKTPNSFFISERLHGRGLIPKINSADPISANSENQFLGWSANTNFKLGFHCGVVECVFVALGAPYILVEPRRWQKVMHQGVPAGLPPKLRSLMAAKQLFPGESFLPTPKHKKPHDGIIDAALLAGYAKIMNFPLKFTKL